MSTANLYKMAERQRVFSDLKPKSGHAVRPCHGPPPFSRRKALRQSEGPSPAGRKEGRATAPLPRAHSASFRPRTRQASSAVSSGASQQMTLGTARPMLDSSQSFSQERIQSPLPQP